jgi:hypothetical protein
MVGANFNETKVNRQVLNGSIGKVDACVVLGQSSEKCRVTRKEGNFASFTGAGDHLSGFSRKENPLG